MLVGRPGLQRALTGFASRYPEVPRGTHGKCYHCGDHRKTLRPTRPPARCRQRPAAGLLPPELTSVRSARSAAVAECGLSLMAAN